MKKLALIYLALICFINSKAQGVSTAWVIGSSVVYRLNTNAITPVPNVGFAIQINNKTKYLYTVGIGIDYSQRKYKSTNGNVSTSNQINEVPVYISANSISGERRLKAYTMAQIGFNYVSRSILLSETKNGVNELRPTYYKSIWMAGLGLGIFYTITDNAGIQISLRLNASNYNAKTSNSKESGIIGNSGINLGFIFH